MINLTEKQKRQLIYNQDGASLLELAIRFRKKPQEVYEYYSYLVDSGEYRNYWRKTKPKKEI